MHPKFLVLAGGSTKGAFQAGVILAWMEAGFMPQAIYGISAGSLNAAFLVQAFGKQAMAGQDLNPAAAAQDLWNFWEKEIQGPKDLIKPLNLFELGWTAIRKNYRGLVSTKPLRALLHKHVQVEVLRQSPVGIRIGAVNVISGGIHYVDAHQPQFMEFLLASSAVPILMPVVQLEQDPQKRYLDGGLRDVSPIRKALEDGAQEILHIACHPEQIEGGDFDSGDLLALVDRVMDIAVNEILNADLRETELSNVLRKKPCQIHHVRPSQPLNMDIQRFQSRDVRRLLELGYAQGLDALENIKPT